MLILKILRFILPPFHPLKYKWINYYYGKQVGGYFITEEKFLSNYNEYLKNNPEK